MIDNGAKQRLMTLCGDSVVFDEPMSNHTSFRIGGPADALVVPRDERCLRGVISFARANSIPFYAIGRGTNLLIRYDGVQGIVVKMSDVMDEIEFEDKKVAAGAGCAFPALSRAAAEHSLSGLEFAIGIPGTVGGALTMNAGAGGYEIGELVEWVKVFDTIENQVDTLGCDDIWFGQRDSFFLQNRQYIILRVGLALQKDDPQTVRERMERHMEKRRRTHPLGLPSAGSIFKRPPGDYAGRLIEAAGLKGLRRGDAEVSRIHAGWIVNHGNASAEDVVALIEQVQQTVQKRFGVALETEVLFL